MLRSVLVRCSLTRSLPGRFVSERSFRVLSVRAPSRLMSTENLTSPTPFSTLKQQLSASATLFTILIALISTAAYYHGELKKLEERVAGTASALKSDMEGVMKEVDAKNAGTEKAVDAKIAGFKEAADLKYNLKSNK